MSHLRAVKMKMVPAGIWKSQKIPYYAEQIIKATFLSDRRRRILPVQITGNDWIIRLPEHDPDPNLNLTILAVAYEGELDMVDC